MHVHKPWLGVIMLSLIASACAFISVQAVKGPDSSTSAAPAPGGRQPNWWQQYGEADAAKARTERVMNGIRIGPNVKEGGFEACGKSGSEPREVPISDILGTKDDLNPGYLPDGVEFSDGMATFCGETLVYMEKNYTVPYVPSQDPSLPIWVGGHFAIRRTLIPNDSLAMFGADERQHAGNIRGKPAVVEQPVIPDGQDIGLFSQTIVIKESVGFTILQGRGMPQSEFAKVAESLNTPVSPTATNTPVPPAPVNTPVPPNGH